MKKPAIHSLTVIAALLSTAPARAELGMRGSDSAPDSCPITPPPTLATEGAANGDEQEFSPVVRIPQSHVIAAQPGRFSI
jgi:hypothetical protein